LGGPVGVRLRSIL